MVVTNDSSIAGQIRMLRTHGWNQKYYSEMVGYNSRLDELQAAVLRAKLPLVDGWNEQRRALAAEYGARLRHSLIQTPPSSGDDYVAHLYVIQCRQRDALRDYLRANGIATEVHYPLLDYQQPFLMENYRHVHLPVSEQLVKNVLTLPCYPELQPEQVAQACEVINRWKA